MASSLLEAPTAKVMAVPEEHTIVSQLLHDHSCWHSEQQSEHYLNF